MPTPQPCPSAHPAAAFPVGFVALLLARSELFTENFLMPVTAVVAKSGSLPALARL